jgi:hypothetical protein
VETYQYGEISTGSLVGGGLLGTVVGFGTGHIVYGAYSKKGWIFTLGESAGLALEYYGTSMMTSCAFANVEKCGENTGLMFAGAAMLFGFRVWEIIDVWTYPGAHNREYRAIKARIENGNQSHELHFSPVLVNATRGALVPGLAMSVRF